MDTEFVKHFSVYIYSMDFLHQFVNMEYHTEWYAYVEKSLHPWDKCTLIMVHDILFIYLFIFYFTMLYWFCHKLTWILHGGTCVLHAEPPSQLPAHPIPLGQPSAPALTTRPHASNLDWRFISHMIIYMFQCHSPISSCPRPLPQSPKDGSIHLCLLWYLTYRVITTIFLNSIYMH